MMTMTVMTCLILYSIDAAANDDVDNDYVDRVFLVVLRNLISSFLFKVLKRDIITVDVSVHTSMTDTAILNSLTSLLLKTLVQW